MSKANFLQFSIHFSPPQFPFPIGGSGSPRGHGEHGPVDGRHLLFGIYLRWLRERAGQLRGLVSGGPGPGGGPGGGGEVNGGHTI